MKYRTKDNDVLDAVCAQYYGDTHYNIVDVIAANPGLAANGPVLPSGILIELPDFAADAPVKQTLRLWGTAT